MCIRDHAVTPADAAQALAMVQAGLSYLATCEAPAVPVAVQAEALTGLERAEARLTAARARMLTAFCAGHGYEADGQYGPKPWLRAFTRVTRGAANRSLGWARRLEAHPAVAETLAAGDLSASWAREICAWTDKLPVHLIADGDAILLAAAAAGADLPDLAALAWEMIERAAVPDGDADGFADRALWLETTLAGAGRLGADLTPACTAALTAVLDALGTKTGPEDTRSLSQRRHDALEEACQRLIAAGMLPSRDGQPLHVYAHMDLATLRGAPGQATDVAPGASPLEGRWLPVRATAGPGAWCPAGAEADAVACDATIVPVVTGHVDWTSLDQLTDLMLRTCQAGHLPAGQSGAAAGLSPALRQKLHDLLLRQAITLLSGPAGLAAQLRGQRHGHPVDGRSQPLDLGEPTAIIPPHLRRAVTRRDRHCRFPGCTQPAAVSQIHHLIPRARGGPTDLANLVLLCRFHHLIVLHRWGWTLTCHADGTSTAVSPAGRTLHSHSPP